MQQEPPRPTATTTPSASVASASLASAPPAAASAPRTSLASAAKAPSASLDDVLAQARWGDVLLFKCRMPHTAVIRTLTFSSYDHVAVVGVDTSGHRVMLEACVLGVRAFPLAARVREYATHFADVVAWRRLLAHRSDAQTAACVKFVHDVDGRRYSYDPLKILFSMRRAPDDKANTLDSAYYCSELVCAMYQKCGLMRKGCRAASFWPGDLTDGGVCERWLNDNIALAPAIVCSSTSDAAVHVELEGGASSGAGGANAGEAERRSSGGLLPVVTSTLSTFTTPLWDPKL